MIFLSLIPRRGGGGGKRAPGLDFFYHRDNCVYAYVFVHILVMSLTHHVKVAVGVLFDPVLSRTVLCLLVADYLEIKPTKGQVASIKCVYRRKVTLSDFGMLFTTTAYQTFPFVSNSIKLGRACSSNVYSIQRTKAVVIFMLFT